MNKKGFTLVELISVMALISLILVLTVPSFLNIADNVKEKELENKKTALKDAMLNYANKNLLDEIKPEGEDCTNPKNCCKYYSIDYILQNNIYISKEVTKDQTGNNKKITLNPKTGEIMTGYVMINYNTSKHQLVGEFVEDAPSSSLCTNGVTTS